jgi:hypothetical protein
MTIDIRDPHTLRQIDPARVSTHLLENGWQEQRRVGDRAAFWTKKIVGDEEVEILLPLDRELPDFHFRISEILQTLAIVEHLNPQEIFEKLVTQNPQSLIVNA